MVPKNQLFEMWFAPQHPRCRGSQPKHVSNPVLYKEVYTVSLMIYFQATTEQSRKRRRSMDAEQTAGGEKKQPRIGEKGFIGRARMPQSITRDYTIRQ